MVSPIDNWFLNIGEPTKGCLHFLRDHILKQNTDVTEHWHYGMPFYNYRGKRICYLWVHKKLRQPYLGIVDGKLIEHPDLLLENRSRMKIFLVDPEQDIPIEKINQILSSVMALYQ